MSTKFTVNESGFLTDVETHIKELSEVYSDYLREVFTKKNVKDFSYNEMAFVRLVSSSSILSMRKGSDKNPGKDNLAILNQPVNKPSVQASKPVTESSALAFINGMSPEERAKFLAMINSGK